MEEKLNATGLLVEQIAAHEATIDSLTRQLAAERERADRLRIAAENVREQWTNKHVVNTPLDKAVVELILALNDQSEPPDTGAKASRPSDPPAQQETRP